MKKLFKHTKKPYEKWNEYEYDEDGIDWDAGEEYYSEEDLTEEEEYYVGEDMEEERYAQGNPEYEENCYAQENLEYEEDYYVQETPEEGEEYYVEEDLIEEGEYYAEEDLQEEKEYYVEENQEEEYYAEEEPAEEGYYAQETPIDEEGYYAQEEFTEEEYYMEENQEEEYYAQEDLEEEEYYAAGKAFDAHKRKKSKAGGSALLEKFRNTAVMDRVIVGLGVVVLLFAVITGGIYVSAKVVSDQVADFVSVGTQLQDLELIGEKGLLALADAERAKQAAADVVDEQQKEEKENKDYNEAEFDKEVTVSFNLTSVQKDLKIKFTNKDTGKLIANIPFSVSVTKPDGKSEIWSDSDMDGIIYEKNITPGSYKVAMNALTEDRYSDYTIPTASQIIEVKKEITYKKVDVSGEVKKESEINASVEDTKKNETVVESVLEDTVAWVESTSTVNTYTEVSKSTIPDPFTIAVNKKNFLRTAYTSNITPSSQSLTVGGSVTVTAKCMDGTTEIAPSAITWKSSNPSVAKVEGSGKSVTVTALSAGTALISYEAAVTDVSGNNVGTSLTGTCSVTVSDAAGKLTVDKNVLNVAMGAKVTAKATPAGFSEGRELVYTAASGNTAVATASVDSAGTVTINGVAAGDTIVTVTANYKGGDAATAANAVINVKVTGQKTIALDKTSATVYISVPVTINAKISNAVTDTPVTAESSDTRVATVAVDKRAVVITAVQEGSAVITVKYTENGETVTATCAVTVKPNPKEDKSTRLKDGSGRLLYVLENEAYREAVYADYYTAEKFFIKGEVKYTGWQTIDGKVFYFDASGKKVTGEQIIQGAKYNFASDGSLVTGSGTMGIDVSKWNGKIDWEAVKNSGVSYVIIRCGYRGSSQGMLIEDPKFAENIKGASNAGLKVGVYFFTQAVDEVEAVYEASYVLEKIKNYKISYPVFLDVEASGGRGDKISKETRTAVCKAFCETIQSAGYTAGIYANKTWLTEKIDASALNAYKIWLAQYAASPTYTGRYDLWQYKSTGKVSGISGNVDLNLSYLGY